MSFDYPLTDAPCMLPPLTAEEFKRNAAAMHETPYVYPHKPLLILHPNDVQKLKDAGFVVCNDYFLPEEIRSRMGPAPLEAVRFGISRHVEEWRDDGCKLCGCKGPASQYCNCACHRL